MSAGIISVSLEGLKWSKRPAGGELSSSFKNCCNSYLGSDGPTLISGAPLTGFLKVVLNGAKSSSKSYSKSSS